MSDGTDPHLLEAEHAPTPYTADEIRAATPEGLEVTTETVSREGGTRRERTTFVRCGEDDADIATVRLDEHGAPIGEVRRGTARWLDLQAHASFPAAITTRTEDTIDHPLGRLTCWRYDVDGEHGSTTFWFAHDTPGMPVRYGTVIDGELRDVTEVVARRFPSGLAGSPDHPNG